MFGGIGDAFQLRHTYLARLSEAFGGDVRYKVVPRIFIKMDRRDSFNTRDLNTPVNLLPENKAMATYALNRRSELLLQPHDEPCYHLIPPAGITIIGGEEEHVHCKALFTTT